MIAACRRFARRVRGFFAGGGQHVSKAWLREARLHRALQDQLPPESLGRWPAEPDTPHRLWPPPRGGWSSRG